MESLANVACWDAGEIMFLPIPQQVTEGRGIAISRQHSIPPTFLERRNRR